MASSHSPTRSRGSERPPQRNWSNTSFATLPSPLGSRSSSLNGPIDGDGGESPTDSIHFESQPIRSYGTLPLSRRKSLANRALRGSRLPLLKSFTKSTLDDVYESTTPHTLKSRLSDLSFIYNSRPKTLYDAPLPPVDDELTDSDAKINGIRVWYTSYTSIDWLHDTIKDSLRFSSLRHRRRQSWRSRIRLMLDKSMGWVIVTIVGFLTAVVAFLVVRSEQWLFDLKEGYCTTSVWKSKNFCCPHLEASDLLGSERSGKFCSAWRPWYQVLFPANVDNVDGAVEYVSYTLIAVSRNFIFTIQDLEAHNGEHRIFVDLTGIDILPSDYIPDKVDYFH